MPKADNWEALPTDGKDAGLLAGGYGLAPDKWQQHVLNTWLKHNGDHHYIATSCGLSLPRQNGKNAIVEMRELYGICVNCESILHTAHRVDTARKAFLRIVGFFENANNPEMQDIVSSIRKANGQESIKLKNGGSIEFSSRANGGARGSTYDVVIFDEAQELNDDQMEAIMSTIAAAPSGNRQQIFTGTPPSPVSAGTVFRRQREKALAGKTKEAIWQEWGVSVIGDITDIDRWYETNPALGIRLDEDFTTTECETLSEEGFARERLGWWNSAQGNNNVLKPGAWAACITETPPNPDEHEKIAYGVKFTPDGRYFALSAAVDTGKGAFVECIDYRETGHGGLNWLARWLLKRKERCSACVVDGKAGSAALVQKLNEGAFPQKVLIVANATTVCAAAVVLLNAIDEKLLSHIGQPDLAASADTAQKRAIGRNGAWGFGSGVSDSALIESVSFAYWGVKNTRRRVGKRSRIL